MEKDTRILECIANINIAVIGMQSVKAAIQPLKFPSGHVLSRDAMFFSIIKICIVIEEINILNGMCKDDIYLRKLMNCVKPFTSTATKYEKDFNNFRNSFVAHLQRDKKKKFKVYSSIFDTLKFHVTKGNGILSMTAWNFSNRY